MNENLNGIKNLGFTCYLSGVIQYYCHNPLIIQFLFSNTNNIYQLLRQNSKYILQSIDYLPDVLKQKLAIVPYHYRTLTSNEIQMVYLHTITHHLICLIKTLKSSHQSVSPIHLIKILIQLNPKFTLNAEHDAEEVHSYLLQRISEELNVFPIPLNSDNVCYLKCVKNHYAQSYSYFKKMHTGFIETRIGCPACGYIKKKYESFTHLCLSVVNNQTLNDCLAAHFNVETLDKDNLWQCEKCFCKVQAVKQSKIIKTPRVLMIQFNRFNTNGSKNNQWIDYSDDLSLVHYCRNVQKHHYTLLSVIAHLGTSEEGHYVYYWKHPTFKKWIEFNDNQVSINHRFIKDTYLIHYLRNA